MKTYWTVLLALALFLFFATGSGLFHHSNGGGDSAEVFYAIGLLGIPAMVLLGFLQLVVAAVRCWQNRDWIHHAVAGAMVEAVVVGGLVAGSNGMFIGV